MLIKMCDRCGAVKGDLKIGLGVYEGRDLCVQCGESWKATVEDFFKHYYENKTNNSYKRI